MLLSETVRVEATKGRTEPLSCMNRTLCFIVRKMRDIRLQERTKGLNTYNTECLRDNQNILQTIRGSESAGEEARDSLGEKNRGQSEDFLGAGFPE